MRRLELFFISPWQAWAEGAGVAGARSGGERGASRGGKGVCFEAASAHASGLEAAWGEDAAVTDASGSGRGRTDPSADQDAALSTPRPRVRVPLRPQAHPDPSPRFNTRLQTQQMPPLQLPTPGP